jgi:hypothetical protein
VSDFRCRVLTVRFYKITPSGKKPFQDREVNKELIYKHVHIFHPKSSKSKTKTLFSDMSDSVVLIEMVDETNNQLVQYGQPSQLLQDMILQLYRQYGPNSLLVQETNNNPLFQYEQEEVADMIQQLIGQYNELFEDGQDIQLVHETNNELVQYGQDIQLVHETNNELVQYGQDIQLVHETNNEQREVEHMIPQQYGPYEQWEAEHMILQQYGPYEQWEAEHMILQQYGPYEQDKKLVQETNNELFEDGQDKKLVQETDNRKIPLLSSGMFGFLMGWFMVLGIAMTLIQFGVLEIHIVGLDTHIDVSTCPVCTWRTVATDFIDSLVAYILI